MAAAAAAVEVTVVDFWCNEFGMRARLALREKRVPFEFVEEDLRVRERSDLVRRMNPVHRAIPILIHAGRPVCGSLNIVEYVDEVWSKTPRLLPADPLERANARFWADFVDQKARFFTNRGEEKAAAMAELLGHLRRLEAVLRDRPFFGGDEFGFLDVALVPFSSMFYGYERHGGVDMEAECPVLLRWVRRCGERVSVRDVLPSGQDMYAIHKEFYQTE
ncbi:probable glutathione S-transferase isoform X2 [Miscanthus floridulus]|uniref:probable glutathione S-transferase isoform X2 n=1 Tax=Miscanthus floridulus TaxID=154761 RepID=UPI0034576814